MTKGKSMNVYQKLHAVMQQVGYVQKQGENVFHKYSYAREADVVRAVRPAFLEQGLLVFPVTQSTNVIESESGSFLTTVEMTFRVQNVDDKEDYIDMPVSGQGVDKGDKSVYKALTGAKKYMLALGLLIETGDDAEADASVDERAAATKTTKNTTRKRLTKKASKEETEELPVASANGSKKLSSFRKRAGALKGGW